VDCRLERSDDFCVGVMVECGSDDCGGSVGVMAVVVGRSDECSHGCSVGVMDVVVGV